VSYRARFAARLSIVVGLVSLAAPLAFGQLPASWSRAQEPFRIHGNTYYVGTAGLASVLITSETGHVLIDGALPGSAEQIAANVRALGFAPGHTPGGTTWTWSSCEEERCLSIVYADSLSPVAAEGYRYTDPDRAPNGAALLEGSFARIEALPCDVLIAPHPEAVGLFDRLTRREQGQQDAFRDADACRTYVAASRERLAKRVALEQRGR